VLDGSFDPGLAVRRASGCFLELADGRRVLDAASGLWNAALGHGRADIIDAMRDALEELTYHVPVHALPELSPALAARLIEHAPAGLTRAMFHSSGTAAVESAVLIARQWFQLKGQREKKEIVALDRSYHGASLLGATLSGIPEDAEPYAPLARGVHHIPLYDRLEASLAELDRLLESRGDRIAALIYEPIAAVAGVVVPHADWILGARRRCRERGILLIADEVTTGLGRTGEYFASAAHEPDIVLIGKSLGAGYAPISAGLYREAIFDLFRTTGTIADVASTMDGQAAPCAAGIAVLNALEREGLVARSAELGRQLRARLEELTELGIGPPRGRGLMIGLPTIGIDKPQIDRWLRSMFADGLALHRAGTTLTIFPPLVISDAELELLVAALERGLPRLTGSGTRARPSARNPSAAPRTDCADGDRRRGT
jgi:adenosylmethionine-8-amino-7-oxononanoate aminotransferase